MVLFYPEHLKKNSTIGLICPGGGFDDYKPIKLVIKYLNSNGYKVKLGRSLVTSNKDYKYLSGADKNRLADLMSFWSDNSIDAIFCLRGGYGCLRLLKSIDFSKLKKSGKIFLGFSDITILLLSIYSKCNLVTFHGPLLAYKFINNKLKPYDPNTEKNIWKLLNDPDFNFSYTNKQSGILLNPGKASGRLIGGNLTDICSMIGSEFLPSFRDSILFLEDCHEEPYKIDRLLTQLLNSGLLDKVNGLIFSNFYKCSFKNNKQIVGLLKEKISKLKIPVIYNFPIGHGLKNYTVPIGKEVVLDADALTLKSL